MLRLFGPDCPVAPVEAAEFAHLPCQAVWIDLLDPTDAEIAAVQALVGHILPTREELLSIEPSARLYERKGGLFLTLSVLFGVRENEPSSDPVGCVLTDRHLVTVRRIDPAPFQTFAERAYADPQNVEDPRDALLGLLDAMIDRLADETENLAGDIEAISGHIFKKNNGRTQRTAENRLEMLLIRAGTTQRMLSKIRDTGMSTTRVLTYLNSCRTLAGDSGRRETIEMLLGDLRAISDHLSFHNDTLTFLLDATLGRISLEQNRVMEIFSVAAVVLMPPTLLAGIWGMNFEQMPELAWPHGYPMALISIVLSAILPYTYARRKGWL